MEVTFLIVGNLELGWDCSGSMTIAHCTIQKKSQREQLLTNSEVQSWGSNKRWVCLNTYTLYSQVFSK